MNWSLQVGVTTADSVTPAMPVGGMAVTELESMRKGGRDVLRGTAVAVVLRAQGGLSIERTMTEPPRGLELEESMGNLSAVICNQAMLQVCNRS